MPSTSKKQHNFMAAIANNPAFAKKVGVPQSVGKDFNQADKGKKFGGGGMATKMTKHEDIKLDKKIVKKAVGMHDKQLHGGKKTNLSKLAAGGAAMSKKVDPRVARMLATRTASAQDPTKARVAAPMFSKGGRTAAKGEHPVQTKSKRGAEMIKMRKGGNCK